MQEIARSTPRNAKPGRTRGRLGYVAVPLAAAGAFAVFAVTTGGGTVSANGTTPAHTSAAADAPTTLLGKIAAVAASKPLPPVRDDQFVYVESKVAFAQDTYDSSGSHSTLAPLHLRQIWQSVDGSRPGLLRENGQDTGLGTVPTPEVNAPDYRYLEGLPTDPSTLLKMIYTETAGEGQSVGHDAEAFTTIGDLLREQIAPPPVTAALYKAAAMIPGVRVIDDVVDATGQHDIAVALDNSTATNEWLFNKSSFEFIGEQSISRVAGPLGPAGTDVGTQIVLQRAIVDHADEVPGTSAG